MLVLGIGHEKDADPAEVRRLAEECCRQAGIALADIAIVASLDIREADGLVATLAKASGGEARYFSAAVLEAETPRLLNPSDTVFRAVGCHGVAEAAALAAAGPDAKLIVPKTKGDRATCAIARRDADGR